MILDYEHGSDGGFAPSLERRHEMPFMLLTGKVVRTNMWLGRPWWYWVIVVAVLLFTVVNILV